MAERILLMTGFEPYGGDLRNPSLELARAISGRVVGGCRVVGAELPVDTHAMPARLAELLDAYGDSLAGVVMVGLANGRAVIGLERVAINCRDFPVPDNAGNQPLGALCVAGGPAAYFSTLPLRGALAALRQAGLPATVSNTAGTYLCNQTMYTALHLLSEAGLRTPAGFVHVPYLPEQVACLGQTMPSLSFEAMRSALEVILTVTSAAVEGDSGPEVVTGAIS